jgi:dephospho-CoA kinase
MKVGITGGIGSGKTTVCKMFEAQYGIPIYYADTRAKYLMNHKEHLKEAIKNEFGKDVYHSNGRINRAKLGGIVFNDKSRLEILNGLIHPAVYTDSEEWMEEKEKDHPYVLKEAALLYETDSARQLDKIIVVYVENEERIRRVMARDKTSEKAVLARMDKQLPQEQKMKMADYLIHNLHRSELQSQVETIHKKILVLCQNKKK